MTKKLLPEERKSQIVQTALILFKEKGYENTSVGSIIEAAGISKGGFYHHYRSKEELLQDIARLFLENVVTIIREISGRDDLTAVEKTNEYIRQVNSYKKDNMAEVAAFLHELYSGGKNVQLENLIFDYGKKNVSPIMKSIIIQGIEEGDFKTDYPEEAAELYVTLFFMHQREMGEAGFEAIRERSREKLEAIKRKYMFMQKVIEDMFGLEKGSLVLAEVVDDMITIFMKELF